MTPQISKQRQIEVVQAIKSSVFFTQGSLVNKVFDILLEPEALEEGLGQLELAKRLYGPDDDEEKLKTKIRAVIHRFKKALDSGLNEENAQRLNGTVQLLQRPYRLEFLDRRVLHEDAQVQDNSFWERYLSPESNPMILFSEPLFFQDKNRTYVRSTLVNQEKAKSGLEYFLNDGILGTLKPSSHFLSTGEVMAALILFEMFQNHNKKVFFNKSSSYADREPLRNDDVITIGSGRTSALIRYYQKNRRFKLRHDNHDEILDSQGEEHFKDRVTSDKSQLYAVVTRYITDKNRCVTLIAANHGGAARGVVNYLTTSKLLKELENILEEKGLFTEFQAVFQVDISGDQKEETLTTVLKATSS